MLDILNCFVWLFCYSWLLCLIVMLDILDCSVSCNICGSKTNLVGFSHLAEKFTIISCIFLLQVEAASIFSLAGCWSPSTSRIASDLDKYVTGEGTLCTKCWVPCLTMNIEQVACFLLSTSTSYLLTLQRKFQTNEWSDDEQIAS